VPFFCVGKRYDEGPTKSIEQASEQQKINKTTKQAKTRLTTQTIQKQYIKNTQKQAKHQHKITQQSKIA